MNEKEESDWFTNCRNKLKKEILPLRVINNDLDAQLYKWLIDQQTDQVTD